MISSSECSVQGHVFYCKPRNQGCISAQRQVFYRKLRNQGCILLGMNRCGSFPLISTSFSIGYGCANHATEGKRFSLPIHCCEVTKSPYLFSGELCTSPLHSKRLFVYTVCCRRGGQCFSVLGTCKSEVILT